MGGTTAKACLVEEGEALFTSEYHVPDYERRLSRCSVAALDIVEVGTGGGSIANGSTMSACSAWAPRAPAPSPDRCATDSEARHRGDRHRRQPRARPAGRRIDSSTAETVLDEAGAADVAHATSLGAQPRCRSSPRWRSASSRLANFNMAAAIRRVSLERGSGPEGLRAWSPTAGPGPCTRPTWPATSRSPRVIVPAMRRACSRPSACSWPSCARTSRETFLA